MLLFWFFFQQTPNQALKTINVFLDKHCVKIEKDITKIKKYLSKNEDNELSFALERIAESLTYLSEDELSDHAMQGLTEIISINFQFTTNTCLYDCILLQFYRMCGLILTRVWQFKEIGSFVCSNVELGNTCEAAVRKDVRDLQRFELFLRGIEGEENILEKDIWDMRNEGKFCVELPGLSKIKELAKDKTSIIVTCVKLSILQHSALWQMHAVAQVKGYGDRTAEYLRGINLSQRNDDIKFYEGNVFSEYNYEMHCVKNFLSCLGCGLQESKRRDVTKPTTKQKLKLLRLAVVPLLEELLEKHIGIVLKKDPNLTCTHH